MIRTRDVVIFASVVLFLCTAIAITLILDMRKGAGDLSFVSYFEMGTSSEFVAEAESNILDRQGIIAHLREALGQRESSIIPSPSVEEESVATSSGEETPDGQTGVITCGGDDTDLAMRSWPLAGVELIVENGLRKAVQQEVSGSDPTPSMATTSTSSTPAPPAFASKTLIAFSASPVPTGSPSCVPGEVIGVTVNGSLMHNSEASFYRGYGSEYLIGYARDGFPVYGYYEGETDSCGGYMHPSGYRYSVTQDKDVVLNCFTGTPSSFSL